MMFKIMLAMSLLVVHSALASVPGEESMECHDPNSSVTRVYLDIWMVGHPMGGFTSLKGMMSVDGHLAIAMPQVTPAGFVGSTEDLSRIDYTIIIAPLQGEKLDVEKSTTLMHRSQGLGPMPAGNWISETVVCRWVQD